jgi:hypothetical protein
MIDTELLQMALLGYRIQAAKLEIKIDRIKAQLKGRKLASTPTNGQPPLRRHHISAAGRARIAAAQRRRWAATKKAAPPQKRKLTAERRAALIERLKKARAAKQAA